MKFVFAVAFVIPSLLCAQSPASAPTLPGSKHLDDSRLVPSEWELTMVLKRNGQEMKAGTTKYQLVQLPGKRWAYITTTTSQLGIAHDTSIARRGTLAPVSHRSHAVPRVLMLDYAGTKVTGSYTPTDSASRAIARVTDVPTFDAAMLDVVLGSLPLATGYRTQVPLYIEERGGLTWAEVDVAGETTVGSVPTWEVRLSMNGYKPTFMLAKNNHRMLGGRVEYPNGAMMEMVAK